MPGSCQPYGVGTTHAPASPEPFLFGSQGGFRVKGLGSRVWGLGFRVQGSGF